MHHKLLRLVRLPRLLPGGGKLYWTVLGVLLLLASLRLTVEPMTRPLLASYLLEQSERLSAQLGVPTQISYDRLYLSMSVNGLVVLIATPYLTIGDQTFSAQKATLVLFPGQTPQLIVSGTSFSIRVEPDRSVSVNDIPLALLGDTSAERAMPALPFELLGENITLSVTSADRQITLDSLQIAVSANPQLNVLAFSLLSGQTSKPRLTGQATLSLHTPGNVLFYLRASGIDALLSNQLQHDINGTVTAEIWGTYRNDQLTAQAQMIASSFVGTFATAVADPSGAAPRLSGTLAVMIADIEGSNLLRPTQRVVAQWQAKLHNAVLDAPEPFLGTPLHLDLTEASGELLVDADGWHLSSPDIRFTGPLGTAGVAMEVGALQANPLTLSIGASATGVDVSGVFDVLPLALGEKSIGFLRRDLRSNTAQLNTLVIAGSPHDGFPWDEGGTGEFQLRGEFFGAELDYATGWPKLTDAYGGFGVDDQALAVTVTRSRVGPVTVGLSRAGIDNLYATLSTLHLAVDNVLGPGDLTSLVDALPGTRRYASELANLSIAGSQALDLALTVPLDTDDPIAVSGAVSLLDDSALTYLPLTLTLADASGDFNFDHRSMRGIATGRLLDSGVRLSLKLDDAGVAMRLDGTFDLAAAARKLDLVDQLPLSGASAVAVEFSPDTLRISSNLRGTAVDLPPPLRKPAGQAIRLEVNSSAGRTHIGYGDNLANIYLGENTGIAVALGDATAPAELPARGSVLRGSLDAVNLDELLGDASASPTALPQPVDLQLELNDATLLDLRHPQLDLQATLNTTVTVMALQSEVLDGQILFRGDDSLDISLAFLNIPGQEDQPISEDTIYVEPGELTPVLPALDVHIDRLSIGDANYANVAFTGQPSESLWQLNQLRTEIGAATLRTSGYTNIKGNPYTQLTLDIDIPGPNLEQFLLNYGNEDTLAGGNATINGQLRWAGSLFDPHVLSMQGTVTVTAGDFVLRQGSGGIRLLNILSPFTLLESLPVIGDSDSNFNTASGKLVFNDGSMTFHDTAVNSTELDINITGSTNLITQYNDIYSAVKINASQNIVAGAIAALNPITGALLLLLNQASEKPLFGQLELNYHITGTWEEPDIQQLSIPTNAETN